MIVPFNVNKVSDKLLLDYLNKFPNKSAFLRVLVYSYMYINGEDVPKEALVNMIPLSMQAQITQNQNPYRGSLNSNLTHLDTQNTANEDINSDSLKNTNQSLHNEKSVSSDVNPSPEDTTNDSIAEDDLIEESLGMTDEDLSELENSEAFANALMSMNGF